MKKILLIPALFFLFISGCQNKLPEEKMIEKSYNLINQDSTRIIFPDDYRGKIIVAGFIFINCPDICPLTIHNMQRIQNKLKDEEISNVHFAAISFDPLRDTPSVLKKTVSLRAVDESNYDFLTGEEEEIKPLLKEFDIFAASGDTSYTEAGEPVYFYTHTDRITLIDSEGKIRKEYKGSIINLDEIISDIKYLGD